MFWSFNIENEFLVVFGKKYMFYNLKDNQKLEEFLIFLIKELKKSWYQKNPFFYETLKPSVMSRKANKKVLWVAHSHIWGLYHNLEQARKVWGLIRRLGGWKG